MASTDTRVSNDRNDSLVTYDIERDWINTSKLGFIDWARETS